MTPTGSVGATAARPERVRLFCLPYAGGSARIFAGWAAALPPWVEVESVELPGRGLRFHEPLPTSFDALVEDLRRSVLPRTDRPYAVFGHSLGAMLGHELVRSLQQIGRPAQRLLVAGAAAPDLPCRRPVYDLDEDLFRAHLAELGGTPPEVLANDELMELVLPLLRADFTLADTYTTSLDPPVTCPITALAGSADQDAPPPDVEGWHRFAPAGFDFHTLPGGHFFIDSARTDLLRLVGSALRPGPGTPTVRTTSRGTAAS